MRAHQLLDQAYSRSRLEELAAAPGGYAEQIAEELAGEFDEAMEAALAGALAHIDATAARAMRVWLERVDLAAPTRNVFATTIVAYAGRLELLGQRAHDAAMRSRTGDPASVAAAVVDAARHALALREGLREGVLALIAARAAGAVAAADRHARDRKLDEPTRRRWSALRRDREALATAPDRIAVAPLAARLAMLPDQLDEPEPGIEPTFADMIELD